VKHYALDTSTLACFVRGEGLVPRRLVALAPQEVAIPAIVAYEIRCGLSRYERPHLMTAFENLLRSVAVLGFDAEAAEHAADILTQQDEAGPRLGPHDVLIAATARRHGCTLVTRKTAEFARVPGLLLEDWY
jgi:tRNA(fMet)-specific endonuclease VapC